MHKKSYSTKPIIKKEDKYNKLTAIKFNHKKKIRQYWLFRCDCGNEKVILVTDVKRGMTKSCGCLYKISNKKKGFKHGMCKTNTYNSWCSMKRRCLNKNAYNYKSYGGREIVICSEWMNFENFYKDMGERPIGKTLDRINNNKGYYKKNCKWSTPKEQSNNTRKNIFLTYKGKTQTVSQWAEELNINKFKVYYKIKKQKLS